MMRTKVFKGSEFNKPKLRFNKNNMAIKAVYYNGFRLTPDEDYKEKNYGLKIILNEKEKIFDDDVFLIDLE
jgi:hypothetical protein